MANLHILEGGSLEDDFGWGRGVKTHRPHLMQTPIMVGRKKNNMPHLIDATNDEALNNRRDVPIVSPLVKRIALANNKDPQIYDRSTHPESASKVFSPIQRGLAYFHEKLPLGFKR